MFGRRRTSSARPSLLIFRIDSPIAQLFDILRLPLLTQAQSIGDQHPVGKQGVEQRFSPHGVALYGDCPERHP